MTAAPAAAVRMVGSPASSTMCANQLERPVAQNAARPDGPPSFQSARIARANDGSMQLYVSKNLAPLNWLEITGDGPFQLVLTLYDTTLFTTAGGGDSSLPSITREAC